MNVSFTENAEARRGDWSAALAPDVTSLPHEAAQALARHYTTMGLLEHASVAAFARFSLELLALGAPADLVRLAADALGDETEHATLCFGLAAAYGGRAVGPGPLDVEDALSASSLEEKVRVAFLEACIGETCAAVEAAEAAERATDPVVAAVLRRISADEIRHAEPSGRPPRRARSALRLSSLDPAQSDDPRGRRTVPPDACRRAGGARAVTPQSGTSRKALGGTERVTKRTLSKPYPEGPAAAGPALGRECEARTSDGFEIHLPHDRGRVAWRANRRAFSTCTSRRRGGSSSARSGRRHVPRSAPSPPAPRPASEDPPQTGPFTRPGDVRERAAPTLPSHKTGSACAPTARSNSSSRAPRKDGADRPRSRAPSHRGDPAATVVNGRAHASEWPAHISRIFLQRVRCFRVRGSLSAVSRAARALLQCSSTRAALEAVAVAA